MLAFLISLCNAISTIVFIPWVWAIIGILTWVGIVYLSAKEAQPWNRSEAITLSAVIGAVVAFISPALLSLSPFIIIVVAVVLLMISAGFGVAKLLKV